MAVVAFLTDGEGGDRLRRQIERSARMVRPEAVFIKSYVHTEGPFCLLILDPILPSPFRLGAVLFGAFGLVFGVGWWLVPGLILMAASIFWSPWFYRGVAWIAAAKARAKVRFLSDEIVIRRLLGWVR